MKQVYDVGGNYLGEEDLAKFVREVKRAQIKDVTLKEIGMWLCAAYTMLQRTGPLLTDEAREYLSQKEGPLLAEGMKDYMSDLSSSFFTKPKSRRARMRRGDEERRSVDS